MKKILLLCITVFVVSCSGSPDHNEKPVIVRAQIEGTKKSSPHLVLYDHKGHPYDLGVWRWGAALTPSQRTAFSQEYDVSQLSDAAIKDVRTKLARWVHSH